MKQLLVLILVSIAFAQCNVNRVSNSTGTNSNHGTDYCQDFINQIVQPSWKKHESGEFYIGDKSYWEKAILANQFCFKGKSKVEIENLLGTPNRKSNHQNSTFYHVGKTKKEATWQLQLNYDKNDKLLSITDTVTFID